MEVGFSGLFFTDFLIIWILSIVAECKVYDYTRPQIGLFLYVCCLMVSLPMHQIFLFNISDRFLDLV